MQLQVDNETLLRAMTAEEQTEFLLCGQVLQNTNPRDCFYDFVKEAWRVVEPNEVFVDGWHILAICEHLEATLDGTIRDLLINVPPRHMKSLLVSVLFPCWVWIKNPGMRFIYSSYAQTLSARDSVKCRRLLYSHWYQETFSIDWELTHDQNSKTRFDNTKGGYRISTSVDGGATGEGGDYIVVDDPHKANEVQSATQLAAVTDWWDGTMSNRSMNPKTVRRIIIMQRLHEADLSGHVIEKGGFEQLCLPAEYDNIPREPTAIDWEDPRKVKDELLWPERFSQVEINKLKRDMGPKVAAGQLQQSPSPDGGDVWHRGWWKFYRELPGPMELMIQSWDLTFKDTERGAFVVGQVWGRIGIDKYLIHQFRDRIGFTDQLTAVLNMSANYPEAIGKYVEEAANGAALINTLKTKISGLIPVKAIGSKLARAEAVSPEIRSGNVYLPDPEIYPWVETFLQEASLFPNSKYMDQVDAASQGLTALNKGQVFDWKPGNLTQVSKWHRKGF